MSKITTSQGAGGERMQEFIREVVLKELEHDFGEIPLAALDDAAIVDGIAFTTDSYTVKTLFFPGGDIGTLAVNGTVNDLAMCGARPLFMSAGLILEEPATPRPSLCAAICHACRSMTRQRCSTTCSRGPEPRRRSPQ